MERVRQASGKLREDVTWDHFTERARVILAVLRMLLFWESRCFDGRSPSNPSHELTFAI